MLVLICNQEVLSADSYPKKPFCYFGLWQVHMRLFTLCKFLCTTGLISSPGRLM